MLIHNIRLKNKYANRPKHLLWSVWFTSDRCTVPGKDYIFPRHSNESDC